MLSKEALSSYENALSQVFDVVVMGGGINGLAIARDAALRGMKVILIEKEDYGAGASSKTSKLAHGGLRYLENFDFALVRESLKERALLLKNAPHLTSPLPFVLPIYSDDPHPIWQIDLGLYLYDYLGGRHALPTHRKLTKAKILNYFPSLLGKELSGGCLYHDAQMLDNRIVIENALAAERTGALIFNHLQVLGVSRVNGRVDGVFVQHPAKGSRDKIQANTVVNATGAWAEQTASLQQGEVPCRLVPTKGVHLVLPKIANDYALLLRAPQDGRIFFIMPWNGYSLVGTTDTFYDGDPDKISVNPSDEKYLLEAINFYFPANKFNKASVLAAFAGLRPLATYAKEGKPSEITRNHIIHDSPDGLITVLGGKYTTHRKIAEDAVDLVVSKFDPSRRILPCMTTKIPLPGALGAYSLGEVKDKLRAAHLAEKQIEHLVSTYGTASLRILNLMHKEVNGSELICSQHPHMLIEVCYAIQIEHARTLEDWFYRRTSIAYTPCNGLECLEAVANTFAEILHWTPKEKLAAMQAYKESLAKTKPS